MCQVAERVRGEGVGMDEVVRALQDQQAEMARYVTDAGADDLLRPSRCPGWTVADVLLHLAQTNEMAVASVAGQLGSFVREAADGLAPVGSVDDWAGALVDLQRGAPTDDRDRWAASAQAQAEAFAGCATRRRAWSGWQVNWRRAPSPPPA